MADRERPVWQQRLRRGGVYAGVVAGVGALLVAVVVLFGFTDDLIQVAGRTVFGVGDVPPIDGPAERTRLIDIDGNEFGVLSGAENREIVELGEIPEVLVDAVIATEDASFYEHDGINPSAILRALVRNVEAGGVSQGGSTITQQYVKNVLLTSERSLDRKITEATWAMDLEDRLSKEQILEGYLNVVYLGGGAYGVATASEYYFSKPVGELTLPEAALLVGIIQSPEGKSPVSNPSAADERRRVVLDRMVAEEVITQAEADEAAAVSIESMLEITPIPPPEHQFYVEAVKQELLAAPELGDTRDERIETLFQGGLTVQTTMELGIQQLAEDAILSQLSDPTGGPMGGVVAIDHATGHVRAVAVGPKTFGPCDVEEGCATTTVNPLVPGLGGSGRQPGSSFKPIITAAALEQGIATDWHTDVTSQQQVPGCGDYRPRNYDGSAGVEDMASALAESNNVFHVKLGQFVGLEDVVDVAQTLGIDHGDLPAACSLPLGSGSVFAVDLAEAYATFANDGVRCTPTFVTEVLDSAGNTLLSRHTPDCEQVLDPATAQQVTTMLQGVVNGGTARRAAIGVPVAAKTGTTSDNRDAWLAGYAGYLTTVTWVGHEIPREMPGVSGGNIPALIWNAFMAPLIQESDLATVDVRRYRMPECPAPPPPPEPAQGDGGQGGGNGNGQGNGGGQGNGNGQDGTADQAAFLAQAEPSDGATGESGEAQYVNEGEYAGFDPVASTILSGVDGDSFLEGVQPEPCTAVAEPSAYLRRPEPEPTPSDSGSPSPSDGATASPSPSQGTTTSEPTQNAVDPSPSGSATQPVEPRDDASQSANPTPTTSTDPTTDDGSTGADG